MTVKPLSEVRDYDVVIVGAGPAGMTAALYTGRAMLKTAVLERGFPGGELLNTEYLDDVPGFPKILGHELAEKFASHAKHIRLSQLNHAARIARNSVRFLSRDGCSGL